MVLKFFTKIQISDFFKEISLFLYIFNYLLLLKPPKKEKLIYY